MPRFRVLEGSSSGHCCFMATVVDTNRLRNPQKPLTEDNYYLVCECLEKGDAEHITDLLNREVY